MIRWFHVPLLFTGILLATSGILMGQQEDMVIQEGREVRF